MFATITATQQRRNRRHAHPTKAHIHTATPNKSPHAYTHQHLTKAEMHTLNNIQSILLLANNESLNAAPRDNGYSNDAPAATVPGNSVMNACSDRDQPINQPSIATKSHKKSP